MASTKSILSGWILASMKVKVSLCSSMLEIRGFLKLVRLSGEDLVLSLRWSGLSAKNAVS